MLGGLSWWRRRNGRRVSGDGRVVVVSGILSYLARNYGQATIFIYDTTQGV
jgi:hypothetical protein